MNRIEPGSTIGIVGGGQLGRMSALAAHAMGYRVHVLEPATDAPASCVAHEHIIAAYDDLDAARRFAQRVDVITFEFENVPAETLEALEQTTPVRPSPAVLHTTRHRIREKTFLQQNGFPVGPFKPVTSADELHAAVRAVGTPAILKCAEFGYDGKGQVRIDTPPDLDQAWDELRAPAAVLEAFVPFERELSVVAARTLDGQVKLFGPVQNEHRNGILDITTAPAPNLSDTTRADACDIAINIATRLDVIGLIAVEMFLMEDGSLLVNELAPRPHNSGHYTLDACVASQFEQHIRAICNLPLADTTQHTPAGMVNLLGDLWRDHTPHWSAALATSDALRLHLYGKSAPRPGRKMAHLTATAPTTDEARDIALHARDAL